MTVPYQLFQGVGQVMGLDLKVGVFGVEQSRLFGKGVWGKHFLGKKGFPPGSPSWGRGGLNRRARGHTKGVTEDASAEAARL